MNMEEITWLVYKILMTENTVCAKVSRINPNVIKRVVSSSLFVVLFGMIGWFLQNKFAVNVSAIETKDMFAVIAQSLVALVALVGVMVAFGFEGIRNRFFSRPSQTKERLKSDTDGWRLGLNKFLKFAVYSFFVVILNLFFIIFPLPNSKFALAVVFVDIALVIYSLFLVIGLAEKTLDIDKDILEALNNRRQSRGRLGRGVQGGNAEPSEQ